MKTGKCVVLLLAFVASAAAAAPEEAEELQAALADPLFRRSLARQWNDLPLLLDDIEQPVPCAQAFRSDAGLYMLDASAKDAPGLLAGSWTHLGNWDECVGVQGEGFQGQMCMLDVGAASRASAPQRRSLRALAAANPGALPANAAPFKSLSLKMAACVPSTCTPHDVERLFQLLFNETLSTALTVQVDPVECTTKDRPALDAADWVAVALYAVLVAVVVASTGIDLLVPTRRPLLAAFSVYTNGKKLLTVTSGGDGAISCLHGIRFLSMAWVVLGHRYYQAISLPNINPKYLQDFINSWGRIAITNATVSVDSFFVLSGLLVGYLFFKQMRGPGSRKFNFPMYYIHRYIRLTPALAVMLLLNSTLIIRMGWGPLWMSTMESGRDNCQASWWSMLLYVDNYVSPTKSCIGQSWYLMVDMQLYWLSPILLFPVLWWPRVGFAALAALCAGGIASNFAISYDNDLPGNTLLLTNSLEDLQKRLFHFKNFYIPAYTRFVPYLIGVATGYVLADCKIKAKRVRFSFGVGLLLWLTVAALLLVPLFTNFAFLHGDTTSKLAAAFYNAFSRPVWACGVALVIFLCATGNGCCINTLLSWQGFQLLSRLSYSVFLVHMSVQNIEAASVRTNTFLSDVSILPGYASDLLIAFLVAAALSLVAESPFLVLEKELLGGRTGKRPGPRTGDASAADVPSKPNGHARV